MHLAPLGTVNLNSKTKCGSPLDHWEGAVGHGKGFWTPWFWGLNGPSGDVMYWWGPPVMPGAGVFGHPLPKK